jgi:hypothetical protein
LYEACLILRDVQHQKGFLPPGRVFQMHQERAERKKAEQDFMGTAASTDLPKQVQCFKILEDFTQCKENALNYSFDGPFVPPSVRCYCPKHSPVRREMTSAQARRALETQRMRDQILRAVADTPEERRRGAWRECGNKKCYDSENDATAAASEIFSRDRDRLQSYQCRFCSAWHIGHSTP